ncbi:zinc metalloproteinase nas-4-like [Scylla paramamosain]|uniref:zinc metalloproteinase nas-4-like n=1 Tax=Scylla paramamosain TaxID=85552 RepID=UPI003082EC75
MGGVPASACLVALASITLAAVDRRFPSTGKEWTPESLINPEELGDAFEGDIVLPLPPQTRNGLIDETFHWPGGRVPYTIDSTFLIVKGITVIIKLLVNTQSLFTPRNNQGCYSSIGRQGGMQVINYAQWCLNKHGSVLHEMLHALGFHHEQSRYDRDNYVTILWDNIKIKAKANFKKYSDVVVSGFREEYNYASVMHYSSFAFTKNKKKTIVTKKLMRMYKC